MNLKKSVAIAAAVGSLAAISAPAMAFENEFHGMYTLQYFLSNYESGGGGPILYGPNLRLRSAPSSAVGSNTTENLKTNNYFEQRLRLNYNAKASDDLKLVTVFEIDSVFGDRAQGAIGYGQPGQVYYPGAYRNSGGAMESDAVNLETKNVYLQFKIPSTPTTVKAGIQNFSDSLKGIMFSVVDLAGIHSTTKLGAATVNAAYFRAYDNSFSVGTATNNANLRPRGMDNLDIGAVEGKYALSKDMNLGLVYYLYADGRAVAGELSGGALNQYATMIHTLGLTADAKVGPVTLSGFAAYQGGIVRGVENNNSAYLNAVAYNLAAKAPVGPGTLRGALLFTSGNDQNTSAGTRNSKHLTGWYGGQYSNLSATTGVPTMIATAVNSYTESNMLLLNRSLRGYGTTDNGIAYNAGNGTTLNNQQGMYLLSFGYDMNVTPKLYVNSNIGMLWAAKTNILKPVDNNTGAQNATNFMGTELNTEVGYKMYDNLTATLAVGGVFLGGYYNGSLRTASTGAPVDPEMPYTSRIGLKYVF